VIAPVSSISDNSEIVLLPVSPEASVAGHFSNLNSPIINVVLIQNGELIQPSGSVEICFEVKEEDSKNSCLSFYDEKKNKFVCEDPCLVYEDGQACGRTSHFTNFALVLDGGGKGNSGCSSDEDWILHSAWQDSVLIASCISFCCIFVALVVLIGISKKTYESSSTNDRQDHIVVHA